MTSEPDEEAVFQRLEADECERLVRDNTVGRVAWLSRLGLQVLPVTYTVIDRNLYFRTAAKSILADFAEPTEVAVQVDDIDQDTSSGWSVLLQGEARITDLEPDQLPEPWAPGERRVVVVIVPQRYSGRVVTKRAED